MIRAKLILLSGLLSLICANAIGQGREKEEFVAPTVLVDLGQPNVWTLEQAHYLLERNRAKDLGIAAKDLDALDPNEVVGFRIDAVRSLFFGQVQFDQIAGAKNRAAMQQFATDTAHFNALRDRLDQLRPQQTDLANQLADANQKLSDLKAKQNSSPSDPTIASQITETQNLIDALNKKKSAVDGEASTIASQITTAPKLDLTSTLPQGESAPNSIIGTNPIVDKLLASLPGGLKESKIAASIKLDNYINLQYEIVAKQLTLLRDEAGPNNRVIFMELPQSIYATQKFKLYPDIGALWGNHLVQTWWRIESLITAESKQWQAGVQAFRPPDMSEICYRFGDKMETIKKGSKNILCPIDTLGSKLNSSKQLNTAVHASESLRSEDRMLEQWKNWWDITLIDLEECVLSGGGGKTAEPSQCSNQQQNGAASDYALSHGTANAPYTVELIPRQSALNVADAHSASRAIGFSGLFGLLRGLGGQARVEHQRDEFSQFTQQEVFASAFGKGQRTFGWTFGPLPGTKRLAPGLRTTYAVLIVPKSTRALQLNAFGCGYRRRTVPKNPFTFPGAYSDCQRHATFVVQVPVGEDDFYVDEIFYDAVPAGQRITVEVLGTFSHEVGVLINGTPLQKVVAIGQPTLFQADFKIPENAGDSAVKGVFELVGSKKLLLSFVMPATFSGTPEITVTSPTRASVINSFSVKVNNTGMKLRDAAPMFEQPLKIIRMSPEFPPSVVGQPDTVRLQIFGQGFDRSAQRRTLLLNDHLLTQTPDAATEPEPDQFKVVDQTLIKVNFRRDLFHPHWHVTYAQHLPNGAQSSNADLDDPGKPILSSCKIGRPEREERKNNILSFPLTIEGQFLTSVFIPTPDDAKKFTIRSTALNAPKTWNLTIVPGGPASPIFHAATIQLKGPSERIDQEICNCEGKDLIGCR